MKQLLLSTVHPKWSLYEELKATFGEVYELDWYKLTELELPSYPDIEKYGQEHFHVLTEYLECYCPHTNDNKQNTLYRNLEILRDTRDTVLRYTSRCNEATRQKIVDTFYFSRFMLVFNYVWEMEEPTHDICGRLLEVQHG